MLLTKKSFFLLSALTLNCIGQLQTKQKAIRAELKELCIQAKELSPHEQAELYKITIETGKLIDTLVQDALTAYEIISHLEIEPNSIQEEYGNLHTISKGIQLAAHALTRIAEYLDSTVSRCTHCKLSLEGWDIYKELINIIFTDCIKIFDRDKQMSIDKTIMKLSVSRQRIDYIADELS